MLPAKIRRGFTEYSDTNQVTLRLYACWLDMTLCQIKHSCEAKNRLETGPAP